MTIGCFSVLLPVKKSRREPQAEAERCPNEKCNELGSCCDFSYSIPPSVQEILPAYSQTESSVGKIGVSYDVVKTIEHELDGLDSTLRDISMKIHDRPEIGFQERYAHDVLTDFMESHGFQVKRHYLGMETAWKAEFTSGKGGRVLGINSEMDALRGIGHACGHNLIAISGCGVALAVQAALKKHKIAGKIVLLGTPAEEGGGGKVLLLKRGAYKDMDICVMTHPGPGPSHSTAVGSSLAMQDMEVEYFGHTAHAGAAPWEGTNSLDAAVLAYQSISVLRQQIKPDHRVHGVIGGGKDWSANVIPDYANMRWIVRAPTYAEVEVLVDRVKNCLNAAALATGCKMTLKYGLPYYDLQPNPVLANDYSRVAETHFNLKTLQNVATTASTDFGNVCYELPAIHPMFAIPTEPLGGNHTPAFTKSAATKEAHEATVTVTKCLAVTSLRALQDDQFFKEVKSAFEESMAKRQVGK